MNSIDFNAIRKSNRKQLADLGFKVANSLPTGPNENGSKLRPVEEIGRRLLALHCAFLYASDFGEGISEDVIRGALGLPDVAGFLTQDEAAIMDLPRSQANEEYAHVVGWFLERMLPLAWILGFENAPRPDGEPIDGDDRDALVQFVGKPPSDFVRWMKTFKPQAEADVIAQEDLFYCAHNAVRSAQLGEETVPDDFDPVFNGGVIHEQRHALTWALSPGVDWDETELST